MEKEDIFVFCDRCGEKIFDPDKDNSVDEDGLIYCSDCYQKLLESGTI